MEKLKIELGELLGEPLSRMEQLSKQPYAHLYSLHDQHGNPLPVLAKTYLCEGVARQEAYKLSVLARTGTIRVPTVLGSMPLSRIPYRELLLLEYLPGIPVETSQHDHRQWPSLMDQIIESMLAWHRNDSRGRVGMVEATREMGWSDWYQQRVAVLWATLSAGTYSKLDFQDRKMLFRTKLSMQNLFEGFDDNSVLVHGNLTLRSMLKNQHGDQLLGMVNPGMMLWAPREYDLFRLHGEGMPSQLLYRYLEKAPVSEQFMARRWFYVVWEAVSRYLNTGHLNQSVFRHACQQLLPWL